MKSYADHLASILSRLTERERLYIVLRCRTPEPSNAQVAEQMDIAVDTVKRYGDKLHKKLEVGTRLEFFMRAVELGLVTCPCERKKVRLGALDQSSPSPI